MDVITTSVSFKGQHPQRRVRVGGVTGKEFAMFCEDNKVFLTNIRDFSKIYLVCDASLFIQMVGLRFVLKPVGGVKRCKSDNAK